MLRSMELQQRRHPTEVQQECPIPTNIPMGPVRIPMIPTAVPMRSLGIIIIILRISMLDMLNINRHRAVR